MNGDTRVLLVDPTDSINPKDFTDSIDLYVVKEAPYDRLFPRCSVLIHHGGAGTCGKAVRHGLPSVVIPIFLWTDQNLWAQRLEHMKLGIHVDRRSSTLSNDVAWATRAMMFKADRRALDEARRQIRSEGNGAARAVDAILSDTGMKNE